MEGGGFAGELVPYAEVLRTPDDLLMEADEPCGDASSGEACSPE
jgi:hypothetical protein